MRITIIPIDGTVITDEESYSRLDLSNCNIPENIHALQFKDGSGWLEFNDGTFNQDILALPDWVNSCLTVWKSKDDEFKNPIKPTPADYIAKCKREAKDKLAETDWAVLPDVGLKNVAEFITYRGILRDYATNPIENPDYPIEPTPIWE